MQTRAVRDMLEVDKAKALALFREILPLSLAPSTCEGLLLYDVSDFYRTLGAVANTAFDEKQRAKEEHLNFLLGYVGQATSAAEISPLKVLVEEAALTSEQRQIVSIRVAGVAERMRTDTMCGSSTAKLEQYWQSAGSKQLPEDGAKLRARADGHEYTESDRSSAEWQQRLTDFLSELDGWTPGPEESEADYYHEKSIVFEALLDMVPLGQQRDKLLVDYVAFVGQSALQQESPVEWFRGASDTLERIRHSSNAEIPKLLDLYQNSGSPTLALEVALEKVLGAKLPPSMTGEN